MSYFNDPLLPSQQGQTAPGVTGTIQRPTGTGFVRRDTDHNSLVENRLNGLLDANGQYIQRARSGAAGAAASRGLLNSSMAAGAGEAAAIDAALPIASQDATTFGVTAQDNMAAENDYLLRSGDWQTQLAGARIGAAASRAASELNFRADMARLDQQGDQWDQEFEREGEQYNTDWDREIQRNEMNRDNFIGSSLINTIFSDPSLWRDPEGAMGFMNYYSNNISSLWDSVFEGDADQATPPPRPRP